MRGGWTLSEHAKERMQEMGLNRVAVGQVVNDPEVTYTQGDRKKGMIAQRGKIAVVFCPVERIVITVLWRTADPYPRVKANA